MCHSGEGRGSSEGGDDTGIEARPPPHLKLQLEPARIYVEFKQGEVSTSNKGKVGFFLLQKMKKKKFDLCKSKRRATHE
jgi:hypothetical protein